MICARRRRALPATGVLATVLGFLIVSPAGLAEYGGAVTPPVPCTSISLPVPPYEPYPTGILPANLNSEIARVRCEVQDIENEALAEWKALPPPTVSGNPPTLRGTGYEAVEILGKLLNFDQNMSPFGTKPVVSVTCLMPALAGRYRPSI